MPIDVITGKCIPFTAQEILDMRIRTYEVRHGDHPTETREVGTNTMRRTFLVDWDKRFNFCELCVGNCAVWNDGGTPRLSRLLPDDKYGRHPSFPEIVATKIESIKGDHKGIDDDDGMPAYRDAIVKVFYEHVAHTLKTDDLTTSETQRYVIPPGLESSETNAEHITIMGGTLHYIVQGGGGAPGAYTPTPHMVPIPFNIGKTFVTQERKYTWVDLPQAAWGPGTPLWDRCFFGDSGTSRPYIGTVNRNALSFDGETSYPTGTMLLEAVSERLQRSQLGSGFRWSLQIKWSFRPDGWNWMPYWSVGGGEGSGIYLVGTGQVHHTAATLPDSYSIYDARPHERLFEVG